MLDKTIAKRVDNREWIEGCLIVCGISGKQYIHSNGSDVNESDKVGQDGCLSLVTFEVDPDAVRKYAGTTKGGQEVHEGSILEYDGFKGVVKWADGSQKYLIWRDEYPMGFVVVWEEHWWRQDLGFWLNEREIKVIGNIIDNPELLEVRPDGAE